MADVSEMSNVIGDEVDPDAVQHTDEKPDEATAALVRKKQKIVREDRTFHSEAFTRMRRDMFIAKYGYDRLEYPGKTQYVVNITGAHVRQKTNALYAKNPRAIAKRKETMDFTVWDEDAKSLQDAMQVVMMAQQQVAQLPPQQDPMTGEQVPAVPTNLPPDILDTFNKAHAMLEDYAQGMEKRQQIDRMGRTLEILLSTAWREQKPLDFKSGMKKAVRRACTTGVGYIELGFQREVGPRPEMTEKMADARARIAHLEQLMKDSAAGDIQEGDAELAELRATLAEIQQEQEIVLREGLIIDFPLSTKVIPDKMTQSLVGFVGSRHITLEYLYTPEQVVEMFGVDLRKDFTGYKTVQKEAQNVAKGSVDDDDRHYESGDKGVGMVCVWKHYDKVSGLVYLMADGCDKWLREPAAPDVFVEDFWPVYAVTFNDVEDEGSLFPLSDVSLMYDQQHEMNRSRQGKREHRQFARPRGGYKNGSIDGNDLDVLKEMKPFEMSGFNVPEGQKIGDLVEFFQTPGVDPNLYDTGEVMSDLQMAVGAQEAQFGGVGKATATESAIAANSSNAISNSSVDDLDSFLSAVTRASSQILLKEMSEEKVVEIVGPGAFWPQMTLAQIAGEIYLDIEAGSSGKPNQAIDIANFEKVMPLLLQIPGVKPERVLKEAIRRLDDRLDVAEFVETGAPAIVAQNRMQQAAPQDPSQAPQEQGAEGADNGPAPPAGQGGSDPAFGSNQV